MERVTNTAANDGNAVPSDPATWASEAGGFLSRIAAGLPGVQHRSDADHPPEFEEAPWASLAESTKSSVVLLMEGSGLRGTFLSREAH